MKVYLILWANSAVGEAVDTQVYSAWSTKEGAEAEAARLTRESVLRERGKFYVDEYDVREHGGES